MKRTFNSIASESVSQYFQQQDRINTHQDRITLGQSVEEEASFERIRRKDVAAGGGFMIRRKKLAE